jgi:two-component system LytT family response regulator
VLIRAYIVDDEPLAVQRLTRLLQETGRIAVAGSTSDPQEALDTLRVAEVDVVFLDIQMPEMTGLELVERLDRNIPVVFTTAYDRYALEAFAVNSIDYLLKPVEAARLEKALDKLERFTVSGGSGQAAPDIRALAKQLARELAPGRRIERIASRVGERTTVLDVSRVTHFFARDKLTFAVSGGREHVVDFTMAELESHLDGRRFVRVHRATIVNVAFVQELYPGVDGLLLRLKDEGKSELSVARDRVRELKERLGI